MPLPFAPPPDESKLYQQLESTTLQTLTAEQLDTIRAKTFSQGTEGNEDEYRRLLLLGLAADKVSLSGPIEVKHVTLEITGANDDKTIFFQPEVGQIWQLNWGQWQGDGTSNLFYQAIDSSGTTPAFANGGVIFFSSATNGKFCTDNSAEIAGGARIFVSNDTPLLAQTYNDTSGADWSAWFTRVR
jgi:hypothetical protein